MENNIEQINAYRPLWVQIAQNALLAVFLLSLVAVIVGVLRNGDLYIAGHMIHSTLYFGGSLATLVASAMCIALLGRKQYKQ